MYTTTTHVRERIEAQGFLGLDDRTLGQINFPLRLAPAICATWAALGTALGSPALLLALAPFAFLGAVLPGHPFDAIYHWGIRPLLGRPPLPRYPLPRRLSCLAAALFLIGAALAFHTEHLVLGHALGWTLVGLALVNVTSGFCVVSFLHERLSGRAACR